MFKVPSGYCEMWLLHVSLLPFLVLLDYGQHSLLT